MFRKIQKKTSVALVLMLLIYALPIGTFASVEANDQSSYTEGDITSSVYENMIAEDGTEDENLSVALTGVDSDVSPEGVTSVPKLSKLYFSKGTNGTEETAKELAPEFSPDVREYTLVIPDTESSLKAKLYATLADDVEEGSKIFMDCIDEVPDVDRSLRDVEITSGSSYGQNITILKQNLWGAKIIIKIGKTVEEAEEAYTVNVVREATLNKLAFTDQEGNAIALDSTFKADVLDYTVSTAIPENTVLNVTAATYAPAAQANLEIAGNSATSGTAMQITPEWGEDGKYVLSIKVGGSSDIPNAIPRTYTVTFSNADYVNPITKFEIVTPPDKTAYKVGETFDPTGMVVQATYNDGRSVETISTADLTFTPNGALTAGTTVIKITYKTASVEQAITVGELLDGAGTASDPYLINSMTALHAIQEQVADGNFFEGKFFSITNDIEVPADWTGIGCLTASSTGNGTNIRPFSGTIDGGGHTLSFSRGAEPLFSYVRKASISNVNIFGTYFSGNGLVANYVIDYGENGTAGTSIPATINIDHVTIKSGTVIGGSGFISGIASGSNTVNITNCTVESGVKIGCNADGSSAGQSNVGSFAGYFNGTVTGSVSYADVYGVNNVGGLVGRKGQSMGKCNFSDCQFHGTIHATGKNVGGIVGSGYSVDSAPNTPLVVVENCSVDGGVYGGSNVGGILGGETGIDQTYNMISAGYIRNNRFTGKISGTSNVGAIIGYYNCLDMYTFIEGNYYAIDCGASIGIGGVHHVDTSGVSEGWHDGVFYFNSSAEHTDEEWQTIFDVIHEPWEGTTRHKPALGYNFTKNHNRTDDPLGKDAAALCKVIRDLGDLNGDGQITNADVAQLLAIVTAGENEELSVADLNGDSLITNADIAQLLQLITAA